MRIGRTGSGSRIGGAKSSKSKGSEGFSPISSSGGANGAEATPVMSRASGAATLGAVDAVMALQGVNSLGERRARSLRKGRRILDALDRLSLSMLDGNTSSGHLTLLKRAINETRDESGDAGLDDALSHIEVRAAVEIAKLERQKRDV
ncbi:MAG: flagellar assembly regulator FliX [Hirschia sp.]|nr:flagellar assembly regulator FliX [Hirschia sp.]MBF19603.1 flagellar assembly regulator FliX [Hirschia sp.]